MRRALLAVALAAAIAAATPSPSSSSTPSVQRFQQLGAFVAVGQNLTDQQLASFAAAGGRWIVVLVAQLGYPDDHDPSAQWNLGNIESLKGRAARYGISTGGWFNGWVGGIQGTTPTQDAQKIADIVHAHNLGPVVLDLESPYRAQPQAFAELILQTRRLLPTRGLGVSTNEPNDSLIYNGGLFGIGASLRRLGVKLLPQWYNAPAYGQGTWMRPDSTMEWIVAHGFEDNWFDPFWVNRRAVPLSGVHGTLEVTGLEGADLAAEISEMRRAKTNFNYTPGMSIYTLETTPPGDFYLLSLLRGYLFLV